MIKLNHSFQKITCPRHAIPLQLFIDEKNTPFSIITWYCEQCAGYWYEDFFIHEHTKFMKPSALDYRFYLNCPKCQEYTVFHACIPGCCNAHRCENCNTGLELKADLIQKGDRRIETPFPNQYHITDGWSTGVGYQNMLEEYVNLGFKSPNRKCIQHKKKLELLISDEKDAVSRSVWFCSRCPMIYFEHGFIKQPKFFRGLGQPGYECELCGGLDFDIISANVGQCLECKSIYQFKLIIV
ncbi:hypothetical protein ACFL27_13810 [candidate division CSSED10-310 bacterium]|uniref:Transcription factor zinc-finger domain-containing protein n=1 Tax=candidate division CSSED10-310 bacterium TaxID=2855610 RepID=A0ABV6YYJ7_UNCC1